MPDDATPETAPAATDAKTASNGASGAGGTSGNGTVHVAATVGKRRTKRGGLRQTPPAPPPVIDVAVSESPIEPATPPIVKRFRRIQRPEGEAAWGPTLAGWTRCPSALIYSSEANGDRTVEFICHDIGEWTGLGDALFGRAKTALTVMLTSGKLYEVGPKEEIAFLACNELMNPYDYMRTHPKSVLLVKFRPCGERLLDSGLPTVHYECEYHVIDGLTREAARAHLKV